MGALTQTPVTNTEGGGATPIVPDWYQQAQQTIAGQGAQIAGQDYQTYQGPRIAALTPDQLNAQQMTRNVASGAQPDPSQMQGSINYGLSQFDPMEVQKYMSPYTSNVINEISRLGNQNLQENIMPGINSTFTGAGQFGSSRNADFANRAVRDNQYNILGQQSQELQAANTGALNQYSAWHNQAIPGAQSAANLSQGAATNLGTAGALQQTQDQNNLEVAYQDFQNQTNYPAYQLGWYANLTNGQSSMPMGNVETQTTSAYAPSGFQTAASVYGLLNGIDGTTGTGK
jgi:hypothetical protein